MSRILLMNNSENKKIVYVVHCVDTEGPLHESIEITFQRLETILGIQMEPSIENLKKIQNKELDLGGKEEIAALILSSHLLDYNNTWEKMDKMLVKIMSPELRNRIPDSFGGGWIFNWCCLDHVGYVDNPVCRDLGHHKIFDHYKNIIKLTKSNQDSIHWHFHPMSFYRQANRRGCSFFNSFHLHDVLCRKIIERQWFPKIYRAGFHLERSDINLFLEQWIPFDISNQSMKDLSLEEQQVDQQKERFGDWRLAPDDWSIYYPHHDHYQLKGNCRRVIARCLNLRTRQTNINQTEVDKAFARANQGLPTLLGITNHDFRNMETEITPFQDMLINAKEKYSDVKFVYSEAVDAFRKVLYSENHDFGELVLNVSLEKGIKSWRLNVNVKKGSVFGPQPYLAIKTKSNRFIHENLDLVSLGKAWSYTFDEDTLLPEDISIIGIASNDKYANTFVKTIDLSKE